MACRCPKQIRRRVVPKLWGDSRSHGTGRFGGLDAGRRDCEADYPLRFGIAGLDLTGLSQKCRKRSEEHKSELQSLMRISYAVFCLKKKTNYTHKSNLI